MRELKTHRVNLKLTDTDYDRMLTLMEAYEYNSVSLFWRDLLNGKRLSGTHGKAVRGEVNVRDSMNRMTASIASVGRQYNRTVSTLESLSLKRRADGSPMISDALLSRELVQLHKLTVKMRDEVADYIDLVEGYLKDER